MDCDARGPFPFHFKTADPDLDRLLKPAAVFRRPADVVDDPDLPLAEKRAILASWASDACAVDSRPGVRQPPGVQEPIAFDEIMAALQDLDRANTPSRAANPRKTGSASSALC
jgi:hypothetical protein